MEELRKCYAELSARLRSIENDHETDIRSHVCSNQSLQITNTERTVLVTDIDEFYMTVKVTKNRYSRQNCVGNYFPYVNDIVKYPLTALPVMYEVSEGN